MTRNQKSTLLTKYATYYPQCCFPPVDQRSAYPFSSNSLGLRKHDWLLVQPEHVTQKPAHPQDTCISSNPICSFALSPAHSCFFFVSLFLSQLRPTIPSDLKRLNQCLCQPTSRQPLATADIIHLFLLTNLSIHSTGNETSPFADKQTVCLQQHTGKEEEEKKREGSATWIQH